MDPRAAWNRASPDYLARYQRTDVPIHYGPWGPDEGQVQLLGPVQGKRILELGCGGGHISVALARQGAEVTGVDISDAQVAAARALAQEVGVPVRFFRAAMEALAGLPDADWDLILSVYALHYVAELGPCLSGCHRLLRPGGRLIFSLDHPFRNCFFDAEEQEMVSYPVRSYFQEEVLRWRFGTEQVPMQTYHRPLSAWLDAIQGAGFQLLRLVEPPPNPALVAQEWPEDSPLAPLALIPQTVIFVARRPAT